MVSLSVLTITFSLNSVIVLINFFVIVIILSFELLSNNCIEITLLILLIYSSALLCLFLVNGILLISSLNFLSLFSIYFFFPFLISFFILQSSTFLFNSLFLYYPSSLSIFSCLNLGLNRVGNLVFDNSLFEVILLIFYVVVSNIKSLSLYSFLLLIILLIDDFLTN